MAELKKKGLQKVGIEVYEWFEHRLGLAKPAIEAAAHPIPASSASWWYVFGSAATVLFVLQIMTGILLALVYTPSANHAWNSLQFLNNNVAAGLVSARVAWLGIGLHDRHCAHPHGAGLHVRGI